MQRAPVLLEQRSIGGLLHERVSKQILELRLKRGDLDQPAGLEPAELGPGAHEVRASRSRSRTVTANCRPITEATLNVRLLSCGRRSIRARSSPWSVSGISIPATLSEIGRASCRERV